MSTPQSWRDYAARSLERERRVIGHWGSFSLATEEEVGRARPLLSVADRTRGQVINGNIWIWTRG